jgi:hypothetical protein
MGAANFHQAMGPDGAKAEEGRSQQCILILSLSLSLSLALSLSLSLSSTYLPTYHLSIIYLSIYHELNISLHPSALCSASPQPRNNRAK